MRAKFEHREVAGLFGWSKRYYVDFAVDFTEEEKAIVRVRDLGAIGVDIGHAEGPPSRTAFLGMGCLLPLSLLLAAGTLLLALMISMLNVLEKGRVTTPPTPTFWYWFWFVVFCAISAYAWYRRRAQDKVIEGTERMVRLKDLVSGRKFTVYAFSPATAKVTEAEIEQKLAIFKRHIAESGDLSPTRAIEL